MKINQIINRVRQYYNNRAKIYGKTLFFNIIRKSENIIYFKFINNLDRDKVVLDYGCGSGLSTLPLIKIGFKNIFCYDISEEMLKIAKENLKEYRNITFINDINHLKKLKFDYIVLLGVIDYYDYENFKLIFDFLKSILNEDGEIIFTFPNFSLIGILSYILYFIFNKKIKIYLKRPKNVKNILKNMGFKIIQEEYAFPKSYNNLFLKYISLTCFIRIKLNF